MLMLQACARELPTAQEAATFDAIIVAGSHYSAYEQHEWIDQLMILLRTLAAQGTRMYGCCFGCQVRSSCSDTASRRALWTLCSLIV
jgi:GMP synthase-like glutamine amidotransferase